MPEAKLLETNYYIRNLEVETQLGLQNQYAYLLTTYYKAYSLSVDNVECNKEEPYFRFLVS